MPAPAANAATPAALFAAATFLSAFLLFQVQPLMGRFILPWFGGSAGVWTTTMMFFQVGLVLGYGYAHGLARHLPLGRQVWLHLGLLALVLLLMPIIPPGGLRPDGLDQPSSSILLLLAVTVGPPYLLLSATGPLLQSWFAQVHPTRSFYRLFALSNAGSLLGLLTYPFLVERLLRLQTQAWVWSLGYALFVLLAGLLGLGLHRFEARPPAVSPTTASPTAPPEASPGPGRRLLWLGLPALASLMLLAVTNVITQDVAAVPLLWVLPLCIYLLSFIISFDHPRWYRRGPNTALLMLMLPLMALALSWWDVGVPVFVGLFGLGLFAMTLSLHGELARRKPGPEHLTQFYLTVALGGALGGTAVALIAPRIFSGYWELHFGLALTGLAVFALVAGAPDARPPAGLRRRALRLAGIGLGAGCLLTLCLLLAFDIRRARRDTILMERNFYGVLRVKQRDASYPSIASRYLFSGSTGHGFQFQDPLKRRWPTSYYGQQSGVGLALALHPARGPALPGGAPGSRPLRIGAVGLGTGTVSALARPGDLLRFYEIDPAVMAVAEREFSYLADARQRGVQVELRLGDARKLLEAELRGAGPQDFDVLVLDAFSSDAVPAHLLTAEAADIYQAHLAADGILAVHVSNRNLDLTPVVRALAARAAQAALRVETPRLRRTGIDASTWVLVSGNEDFLSTAPLRHAVTPWPADGKAPILWTDSFSSLLSVLD